MTESAAATAFMTGAGGFIGTELINVLVARGCKVLGLTRSRTTPDWVFIRRRSGDVTSRG